MKNETTIELFPDASLKKIAKVKRVMQQCIGPHCSYDANCEKSPTGFTWKELQAYRDENRRKSYAAKNIHVVDLEMLCDRPVPTYKRYKEITSKAVNIK